MTKFYLFRYQLPELQGLSWREKRRISLQAHGALLMEDPLFHLGLLWLLILPLGLAIWISIQIAEHYTERMGAWRAIALAFAYTAPILAVTAIAESHIRTTRLRPFLREARERLEADRAARDSAPSGM